MVSTRDKKTPRDKLRKLVFVSFHLSNCALLGRFPQPGVCTTEWLGHDEERQKNDSLEKTTVINIIRHFGESDAHFATFFAQQREIRKSRSDFQLLSDIFSVLTKTPRNIHITLIDEPPKPFPRTPQAEEYKRVYDCFQSVGHYTPFYEGESLGLKALSQAMLVKDYQMQKHSLIGTSGTGSALPITYLRHSPWQKLYTNLTFLHLNIGGWHATFPYEGIWTQLFTFLSSLQHLETLELLLTDPYIEVTEGSNFWIEKQVLGMIADHCQLPKIQHLRIETYFFSIRDLVRIMVKHGSTLIDTYHERFAFTWADRSEPEGWEFIYEQIAQKLHDLVQEYAARGFEGKNYGDLEVASYQCPYVCLERVTIPCPKRSAADGRERG